MQFILKFSLLFAELDIKLRRRLKTQRIIVLNWEALLTGKITTIREFSALVVSISIQRMRFSNHNRLWGKSAWSMLPVRTHSCTLQHVAMSCNETRVLPKVPDEAAFDFKAVMHLLWTIDCVAGSLYPDEHAVFYRRNIWQSYLKTTLYYLKI